MDILEKLTEKALSLGAFKAGSIAVKDVPFDPGLRKNCELNYCGAYGRNYTCPPDCGDVNDLIARVKQYETLFLFQTVSPLEDSYDIEGMQEAALRFQQLVRDMQATARALAPGCLILGAGGCRLCERCGKQTGDPCRHPEDAHPSLEAHGMYVAGLAQKCGMKYINGQNTVTYFGAIIF